MKKYIIPIAVILAFLSGALLNSGSKQAEKELKSIRKKERVMFQQQIIKKQVEIHALTEQSKAKDRKIAVLEVAVEKGDQKVAAIETHYKKKLADVSKYTPAQRDSFFYAKYPGQDTIRNVDSRKVIADLVRGEGQDSLNTVLKKEVIDLKDLVKVQKEKTDIAEKKFEKQKENTVLMENFAASHREDADYYRGKYRKQRNQKGILTAGVAVLIGLLIIK